MFPKLLLRDRLILGIVLALAATLVGRVEAQQAEDWSTVERQFRELPMEARRLTGPLFWLHGDESQERLEMYLEKVAEGGNGSFTAESRPHVDWLGPGWYRDLKICLDAAKRLNLEMWIFDEQWWPSGEVGGKVPQQYGCKFIDATATAIEGPKRVVLETPAEKLVAVLAGKEVQGSIDGASLVDLTDRVQDGKLAWEAPASSWKIIVFTWRYAPKHRQGGYLVDGASRDAVDWYIRTVYQPHFDHFGDDFGKTIRGYFYDEPETPGDWGTEVIPELKRRGVDWKKALVAWKLSLADPEEQIAAKYAYQDAFAETWGRTLYGRLTEWCRKHKVASIGHWLEHNREYLDRMKCAGNMFQVMKYSDMGAIDAVFKQFVWGRKDDHTYQTPKLGSSISHAYGKKDDLAMVEIFGARGQDLSYPEMKWWTDHMHASGINFHIPHSFNPRAPFDRDCPPYFYNGGYEPRWPLYRVYADYTSRLSLMLTGGRHVCPVALLYLGNSFHVGKSITPENMTTALQDALFDCDWIPYDVFADDIKIAGRELKLREERYRVLVVPAVEVVPYETLAKAKEFFDAGGVVVGYGLLPSKSATMGKGGQDTAMLRNAIWGGSVEPGLKACRTNNAGGRSYFLPEKPSPEQIRQTLTGDAKIRPTLEVVQGETADWLHVLHRVKAGRDVFFIANQHHDGPAKPFRFRVSAAGVPEVWDAMSGASASIPFETVADGIVEFNLTLEPLESVLLVFQPAARELPRRIEAATKPAQAPIEVQRLATPPELVRPSAPQVSQQKKAEPSPLQGGAWVWYPEGNPAQSAPPGARYFRKQLTLPQEQQIAQARFVITADNEFVLYVNGQKVGASDGSRDNWRRPAALEIAKHLRPGVNQLAIAAVNTTDQPSPAGLTGRLQVKLANGDSVDVRIDRSWKSHNAEVSGWTAPGFNDAAWQAAKEIASFGAGPWGDLTDSRPQLTPSPVKADPFVGRFALPAEWLKPGLRVYLEAEGTAPENAAAVKINGKAAGGFLGRPSRVEVTSHVKAGENAVEIQPFAPAAVRIMMYSDR